MEQHKKSSTKPAKAIREIQLLLEAIQSFITEHSGFESSAGNMQVVDEIGAESNINRAALVPLRHKIFSFEVALRWAFFLSYATPQILQLEERSLKDPSPFDANAFFQSISSVYDTAVENTIKTFYEDDEDDDDEDDEDGSANGE